MAIPKIYSYRLADAQPTVANKVDWPLDKKRAALLVHDMQRYFLGFFDQEKAPVPELVDHCRRLIAAARERQIPIVYTLQPGDQPAEQRRLLTDFWGRGLEAKPEQTEVVAGLAPMPGDRLLTKWRYSAFQRSSLRQDLTEWGRDQLVIVGVYTHIGIQTTALDAFMQDIQTTVVSDAVADFSRSEHQHALNYIATRCGQVLTTQQVINAWKDEAEAFGYNWLLQELATVMRVSVVQLSSETHLIDAGLDSIQAMRLVERWQRQGLNVSFPRLAEDPTVAGWWRAIREADRAAA
ncbi:hypothetical protein CAI21_11190 [Alkalilimnicola ehrlichii]|uniref:isochorismatase n=1 Tax=Alkalilimnicola ehrlichii TaxID=351052 RepID=A0A3E0X2Q7_9GAMM|nr:isochorismatase family protein [Alkalilimnicola ehrlichii]RFA29007.1 hypothetical protein CAI21_11190 [Alkalilimnicola ehrlichii]RFA38642.1 hypothetical protein CAL65_04740 [Alkalilimnicola ehrlichii]